MEEEADGPEGKKSREVILEKNRPKGKHREFRDRSRRHQLLGALDGLSSQEGGGCAASAGTVSPLLTPAGPFWQEVREPQVSPAQPLCNSPVCGLARGKRVPARHVT